MATNRQLGASGGEGQLCLTITTYGNVERTRNVESSHQDRPEEESKRIGGLGPVEEENKSRAVVLAEAEEGQCPASYHHRLRHRHIGVSCHIRS